ncbi:MAG: serine/threonine protein kinase [Myxococcales bacterium]|nr:serine/threonine protein kinase [Myxococcales bacterium]
MDVKPGNVLAGKYRVERVLGQGGMGLVVAATHLQLDQMVALKFLLPEAMQSAETLARFSREARAAAKIRSEHVARVIDVGALESGMPYIVMEYLDGADLSGYAAQRGPLPIPEAADLTLQACEGVAEAHALGIVHRDLKPANLFLTRRPDGTPCLKILDFGISKQTTGARAAEATNFDMTKTGAVMGSPYYMSPEQMRSTRAVDVRTDIWSLGIILYELVAGRVPFDAPSLPHLCAMILTDPLPPLRQFRPDVPPRFEALVLHCLEKAPELRFQSVAELAAAIAEFAPEDASRSVDRVLRLSGALAPPNPVGGARPAGPQGSEREHGPSMDWGRTSLGLARSKSVFTIATVVAALGAIGVWGALRMAARAPAAQPPTAVDDPARIAPVAPPSSPPLAPSAPPPAAGTSAAPLASAPRAAEPTTSARVPPEPAGARASPREGASAPTAASAPNRPGLPRSPPQRHANPQPSSAPPVGSAAAPPPSAPSAAPLPPRATPNPLDGRL